MSRTDNTLIWPGSEPRPTDPRREDYYEPRDEWPDLRDVVDGSER